MVLRREGNSAHVRDRGALESALERPKMAAYYEQADLVRQTALLIAGIALGHAALDGNKRTAAIAGATYLDLNGYYMDVTSNDDTFGKEIEALVAHHDDLDAAIARLMQWLRSIAVTKT